MGKKITTLFRTLHYLPVKKKMYMGFGVVVLILSIVLIQTLVGLTSVSTSTRNVLEKHQPAMITALKLSEKVKDSLSSLGFFLLSKEDVDRLQYETQIADVSRLVQSLKANDSLQADKSIALRITRIEDFLEQLAEVQATMIAVSSSQLKNFPAVNYSDQYVNPVSQTVLQKLQQIIDSENEEYGKQARAGIISYTNRMRYTWARMMSELRAFLGFRTITNHESINDQLAVFIKDLDALSEEYANKFTFEQEEALEVLNQQYKKFIPEIAHIAAIHGSDAWRQDADIFRTRARAHIVNLNNEIDALVNELVDTTRIHGEQLSNEATTISLRITGMLLIGIIAVLVLAKLLATGIIRPMSEAVDAGITTINNAVSSLSGESSPISPDKGGDEISNMKNTFEVMSKTLADAIQHQQDYTEQLQTHVDMILDNVNKAAAGDLSTDLANFTGTETTDELAHGVQAMINSLNQLVSQVQQAGIQVTSSATEIAATANQQQATVTEQAAATQQIMATATEISATSRELASTMREVAGVADQTAHSATDGQQALTSMESTMRLMSEATASITSKLAVLSEKAANINTVVTTITKVADQTNLLSLNAAIEAEKAGEYGLGFSVVATEIRRLADQTAVATWDIEQMVKEMQSAVSAGVMGMDKFSEEVTRGVQDVQQISGQLARIIDDVQTLTPRFETVNEGMQSQSLGAQQISEGMVQLNEAAQQTVESLRQSSASINTLKNAAHDLQKGVSKFKVG
ncbi:methyl-accepting chemotaxis protein [Sulfuriflexus sp.]|uniref:methyl-accepting chemotaxis protein n=1 Tax=Sulfuriflexus sp. TaxID=2015443 RepID=UPI0028CF654A|nr:methyl-accepting chemotaxis protein [Sulfuriflexus sp.]MDT8403817.1 methyl-accepting chemotaxis protein [Sulfuriflexus sp.]